MENNKNNSGLRKLILESISGMKYGQVVFVIKSGRIVQVDRTDKNRITTVEGQYGDGI